MDKPIEIFISYSSKDVSIADAVCQYLEKQGLNCWIAPRDIRAGCDYGAEINAAIKVCNTVILIFSKNSNASRDVTNEVNLAFTKGKIIIPFKIEEVELSDSLEYYLGRVHWTNAVTNPESHFEKLMEQCIIHTARGENPITVQKSDTDINPNKNKTEQSLTGNVKLKENDIVWVNRVMGIYTDPRDGHQYKVIKIGKQIWFAENLAYMPYVSQVAVQGGIWVYGYDGMDVNEAQKADNYKEYGCLYDWETVTDPANPICPPGWHLPSDEEWTTLTDYLGGKKIAGGKLKEKGEAHWESPNKGASNESGFSALPGGYRIHDGSYHVIGDYGHWWSSTEFSATGALDRTIYSYDPDVSSYNHDKRYGFSVRCVRDLD